MSEVRRVSEERRVSISEVRGLCGRGLSYVRREVCGSDCLSEPPQLLSLETESASASASASAPCGTGDRSGSGCAGAFRSDLMRPVARHAERERARQASLKRLSFKRLLRPLPSLPRQEECARVCF